MAGVYTDQRLTSPNLERPSEESQGFKPDPGNLAVRDYRGASGNVSHGETVNPSCNRKSRNGNPSPTAGRARFLSQCSSLLYLCYETRRSHKPIAAARSRLKAVRRRTSLSVRLDRA